MVATTGQEVMRMSCLFAMFGGLFPRLALLILDVGDKHPHGYASYVFTRRAEKLLEER
jgi:hypothetical protein